MKITNLLSTADLSRIIEMAWENKTPFDAIQQQYNLKITYKVIPSTQSDHAPTFPLRSINRPRYS